MDFGLQIRNGMGVEIITPPRSTNPVPPEKMNDEKAVSRVMAIFMDSLDPTKSDYAYEILQAQLRKLFLHIRRDAMETALVMELPLCDYQSRIQKRVGRFITDASEKKSEGWRLQVNELLEQFCGDAKSEKKDAFNPCTDFSYS